MKIKLIPLTEDYAAYAAEWRNHFPEALRTAAPSSGERQRNWFKTEVCRIDPTCRWWTIISEQGSAIGYCGIENIAWENHQGEISLLIAPGNHGKGFGQAAANELLRMGFERLNFDFLYGEVFHCNKRGIMFWEKWLQSIPNPVVTRTLPNEKWWDGRYWDTMWFKIGREVAEVGVPTKANHYHSFAMNPNC